MTALVKRIQFFGGSIVQGLQQDFDLVEGTNFVTYIQAWIVGQIKRRPIVFCIHDLQGEKWVELIGPQGHIANFIEKVIIKLPGVNYLAVSQAIKLKLIKAGVRASKISIGYNGVEKIKPINIKKSQDILCVNRLVAYKNTDIIISAVNLLKKKYPHLKASIVGQGPEKDKLQKLINNLSLQKTIRLTGLIPKRTDVFKLMAKSKVYVSASTVEGFGISVIEAAQLGLPFVISDIPPFREVSKHGKGGYLVKPFDTKLFAKSIDKLLSHKELYNSKSHQAKDVAKNYNWLTISKELKTYYEHLYQKHQKSLRSH